MKPRLPLIIRGILHVGVQSFYFLFLDFVFFDQGMLYVGEKLTATLDTPCVSDQFLCIF